MLVLALDISTKTGWALFKDKHLLVKYGQEEVTVVDYNFRIDKKSHPEKSPLYPKNFVDSSNEMADKIFALIKELKPDIIVIENTTKSKNRHSQRWLEWCHKTIIEKLIENKRVFQYIDVSEWRSRLNIKLSKEDKKNNIKVNKAKKLGKSKKEMNVKGKIKSKHISVRYCNQQYNLNFKLKDNNIADAICVGSAYLINI